VRGVGPLPAARREQLVLPAQRQERVERLLLGPARDQPAAELARDRGVEAGVGQLQPEQVLPVDAAPDGVRGPPVRRALGELEQRHRREPPRALGRLTAAREERPELVIGEDRPERVAQAQVGAPVREGGARAGGRRRGDHVRRGGVE
jgi:hypothetical protein